MPADDDDFTIVLCVTPHDVGIVMMICFNYVILITNSPPKVLHETLSVHSCQHLQLSC